MEQIHKNAPENVQVVLVGNKIDMEDKRAVSTDEGELNRQRAGKEVRTQFLRNKCQNGGERRKLV